MKSRDHRPAPFWLVFALALAALTAIVAVSFLVGRYAIDPWEAVRIMASRFLAVEHTWRELDAKVVWEVRWPRTLMAVLVGAALANLLSGAFSPLVPSLAFGMGILGVLLAYALARVKGMTPTIMLVLSGVVVSSIFNAGVSIMKYLADPEDDLPAITFWLMGSLSGMRWENLAFAAPIIVAGLAVLMVITWQLNLLTMGDVEARSLGANAQRTRLIAIVCATAMTATAVSQSGAIGWVGLVIPHMARILVGPDHRKLVPIAAVLGAAFLLTIDSLTRTVSESSLPLSIPTALVGAPFFAILLRRSKGVWTR
ncbi:MAG: iron ABC transporter permease [Propionibacteriaceae bacterium]|nr:iron ABC transporter permease [Propionibacteriaceae bacterium]